MDPSAEDIKKELGLLRHPTCGYVVETYRSQDQIPVRALEPEYNGSRPFGSALYFLVTPDAQIVLHRIRSDQLYHHYLGDPLEVLMLYPNGAGAVQTIGSELLSGMRPQLFIPGGTFHVSRLAGTSRYALLASTEWPGVEPPDVEHGDVGTLLQSHPDFRSQIEAFTGVNAAR